MKMYVNPILVVGIIIGLSVSFLSERTNWAIGFLGGWIEIVGITIVTVCFAIQHAKGESKRHSKSSFWDRLTYKLIYCAFVSYIFNHYFSPMYWAMFLSQAFLFSLVFFIAKNRYNGNHCLFHNGATLLDKVVKKMPYSVITIELIGFSICTYYYLSLL